MKKKLTCDVCSRTFFDPSPKLAADMLTAHKELAHRSEPSGRCRVCGYNFPGDYAPGVETCGACDEMAAAPLPDASATVRAEASRAHLRLVPRDWPPVEPDEPDPTGTDSPSSEPETTEAEPSTKNASGGDSVQTGGALTASRETLRALKVINDARVLAGKQRGEPSGGEWMARLTLGTVESVIDVDKVNKWAATFPADAVFTIELAEDGLTVTSGTSFIRFARQSGIPFSLDVIGLAADDAGNVTAPALPSAEDMKQARKALAATRKAERLRKFAVKANRDAGEARAEVERERARYVEAQELILATSYAEALNLAVGIREARRELRRLRAVTGEVEITYGTQRHRHGGSRKNANYEILREPVEHALDAFVWASPECRTKYAELFKAYARKRSEQARAEATLVIARTAEAMFYTHLSEQLGEEFADAVRYPHSAAPTRYRRARRAVRNWPSLRNRLEYDALNAEGEYMEAFEVYNAALAA